MSEQFSPTECLAVIARDLTGQIVTRITSQRGLYGAMNTAGSDLRLKPEAVRVEAHLWESSTLNYLDKPLAAMRHEDLFVAQYGV